MSMKEVYKEDLKKSKENLIKMKHLKEANIKALREARNDVSQYRRKVKEYTYTINSINDAIREYNRRIKRMQKNEQKIINKEKD